MNNEKVIHGIPRGVEAIVALCGLLMVAPVLLLCGAFVALSSPGPIIFRQQRVGRGGRLFTLYKLRTMRVMNAGPQVTARDDARLTGIGKFLRRTKLDELPELWNVVRGDMSLVGPRPEVPRYVDQGNALWQQVLRARPGLTDPVTLKLRNEEALLAGVPGDKERFYLETLQPYKLRGYLGYFAKRNCRTDLDVLWKTAIAVFFPSSVPPPTLAEVSSSTARIKERTREPHLPYSTCESRVEDAVG